MELLVLIASWVINVLGSFATDGAWKTAGLSVAQFYWNYTDNKRRISPERIRMQDTFAMDSGG